MRSPLDSPASPTPLDRGGKGSAVRILKPSLRGVPFQSESSGGPVQLLSERQRLQLGAIASELKLPARTVIYREEAPSEWVFIVREGALKSFRELASGKRAITAFLFQSDMFGLAEAGRYVNSIQALTPVVLHRFRTDALADMLRRDAGLEFQFLCKVTHELRQSQRQLLVVSRRHALGRLAMFLHILEERGSVDATDIDIPMSRADTASYLGLSAEAVTRACAKLQKAGIVGFTGTHSARILHRGKFDHLVAGH
jgi:CRP-like cAMP-binding protein